MKKAVVGDYLLGSNQQPMNGGVAVGDDSRKKQQIKKTIVPSNDISKANKQLFTRVVAGNENFGLRQQQPNKEVVASDNLSWSK